MQGGLGPGFDEGKKRVKWIVGILIAAFVIWFLYEGLGVIFNFQEAY